MNIQDLMEVVRHVRKEMECPHCKKKYNLKGINILASSKTECLLELNCQYCKKTTLTDIVSSPKGEKGREQEKPDIPLINKVLKNGITDNDVLDIKNFLNSFDGDFKKLFEQKK